MTRTHGWKTQAGIIKEVTYGTAPVVASQIPFISEGITQAQEIQFPPEEDAEGGYRHGKLTGLRYSGPVSFFPVYEVEGYGDTRLIEQVALGAESNPSVINNNYYPSTVQPGSVCLCFDKEGVIHQHTGGKVLSMTIASSLGEPWKIDADMVFQDRTTESLINTTSSGWSLLEGTLILFDETKLYINDYSAGAPVAGDEVIMTDFSVSIANDYIVNQQEASGYNIGRPKRIRRTATAAVGLIDKASFQDDIDNKTVKKGYLQATLIGGPSGYNYYKRIWLPSFRITNLPGSVDGPGIVLPKLEFQMLRASSPTGFPAGFDTEIIYQSLEVH